MWPPQRPDQHHQACRAQKDTSTEGLWLVLYKNCVLVKARCRRQVKGWSHQRLTSVHSMCFVSLCMSLSQLPVTRYVFLLKWIKQCWIAILLLIYVCLYIINIICIFNSTRLRLESTLQTVNVPSAPYVGTLCTSVAAQLLFSHGTSIPWLWQPSSFCVCGWQNTLTC